MTCRANVTWPVAGLVGVSRVPDVQTFPSGPFNSNTHLGTSEWSEALSSRARNLSKTILIHDLMDGFHNSRSAAVGHPTNVQHRPSLNTIHELNMGTFLYFLYFSWTIKTMRYLIFMFCFLHTTYLYFSHSCWFYGQIECDSPFKTEQLMCC